MGVTLLIKFEKESRNFYPGETIRGNVTMWNDSDINVKGLVLTVFGEAQVYWTESQVSDSALLYSNHHHNTSLRHAQQEYRNQETILSQEVALFAADAETETEFPIPPGVKEYPFQVTLPVIGLPSTFTESPFGSVRYSVEARLKRRLFRYDHTEKEIFVNGILDLSFLPNAQQPFCIDDHKELGWLCCPVGSLLLDLKLPKIGYIPGELLTFSANLLNFSSNAIEQTQAILTQEIEFNTFSRKKIMSADLVLAYYGSQIDAGVVIEWNDSIRIPNNLPPTNLAGCRIIRIAYKLRVIVRSSEGSLEVTAPIIIGTGPCSLHSVSELPVLTVPPPRSIQSTSAASSAEQASGLSGLSFNPTRHNEILLNRSNYANRSYNPTLNPFLELEADDLDVIDITATPTDIL